MPPKVQESPEIVLTRARAKRDDILNSIKGIHATALEARSDVSRVPSLIIHADDLNRLVEQFQSQRDVIINALIDLNRIAEFEQVDRPLVTSMESIRLEIKTIVASAVHVSAASANISEIKSSCTAAASQHFIPLPKIELPHFDGDLLEWRSYRDIFVSLVHDNTLIGDAQRFHFLLASLKGDALAVVKSIPLSADNYALAWEALSDRFDNKRLLASAHLDKLFAFKPIAHESLPALSSFVNTFKKNVSLIKSLGVNDLASFLLFHMGARILDPATMQLFESSTSPSNIPTFDELLQFVQQRCRVLENIKKPSKPDIIVKPHEKYNARNKVVPKKSVFAATTSTSVKSKSRGCLLCDKVDHRVYQCPKFNDMTVEKRREFVAARRLCFSCMSSSHMLNACSSTGGCRSCSSKRHNFLLHLDNDQSSAASKAIPSTSSGPSADKPSSFSGAACTNSTVVLGTAIVHIKDAWDQTHSVRVLLDSCSQISAMTSDCFARLGLSKRRFKTDIVGLAQSPVNHVQGVTSCQFSSHFEPHLFPSVDLVILTQITTAMPSTRLPASVRSKYQHLCLADNNFDIPSRVDVLFGADILPSLVRAHAGVEHHPGLPSALDTQLGWIVFGSFTTPNSSSLSALTTAVSPPSIGDLLQKFWLVEEPAVPSSPTTEDQWCEEYFKTSTSRDTTGRFCVALPFRHLFTDSDQHQDATPRHGLGDSRSIALKRFYNLEKRLTKDSVLYAAYRKFMSTYQSLGHMVPAPAPGTYFISHHAVLKADGDVSKIRVVFDASSASSSGRSLNDVLCTGPKLQVDLRDILLRCRMHRYILSADIVKKYRQILIRPEDRTFQHIFWRDSPNDELVEFQLCTVTYGLNCAPYLAVRCLHELDRQEGHRFPLAKDVLTRAPYVDEKGVIRVGGRLHFSSAGHDAKHPMLLPRSSHLTELIIRHYHLSLLHGGSRLILSMLNQKYWILSGRAAVRRAIFSCVPCTRHKAVRPQPLMADLPSYRVQPHRPFSHVGMDYGGPFLVKEHRRRNAHSVKVYLALFICMSVKAVHLEIVSDLSTDAFLAALDRFVVRRGIPSNLYSDCGTNYVGGARQLKSLFRDAKAQDRLSSHLNCT
ncbi:uncharacterized protein LOC103308715 [Acyrthosiphon pisum]|uniref:Integrase catalytic domain-containing protein n=1 Tax=Acyrthosiphon pisum TaxID=7029 RepID=A0A8R2B425_ACYPI|nr:uncharacterized protein LOC103308715 [Acyrthosiphon pisum]|eukprot:XP_008180804.1 PREDICTED: uncharacterized protein LOC103308715 [Acyrthosiphon pisum]